MPDFPIIDAHVHLYDPAAIRFDWMRHDPLLNKPHGLAEFERLTAGVEVDGVVFVEVDAAEGGHVDEARWVEAEIGGDKRLRGMVACAPLHKGAAVEGDLEALAALPHVRGIRWLLQKYVDSPGWALQPSFVEGVRLLPRFGLSFDLCIFHPQLKDAIALVRACPEVRFVMDHIAKPGIKAHLFEPWASDLKALAQEPNVECKISGVATEADHAAWTEEQISPYIRHAIDCFGFERVMFGGDWPVSEHAIRYAHWVGIVDRVCAGASRDEIERLYRGNATRFYRL
ncbi:amidohydrolase family protein [Labrys monachus]|uniref:L-fuconolactonase n=1 Tax=Labrys monachus TaxID=217067 RepID=A0ABU0FNM4_9HYPH|nr:amidohydrolase family protein [Labrys monachus]MDQ0396223.1 L-fuconolactonase [Labrys monachus]